MVDSNKKKLTLEDLTSGITEENRHAEIDFGTMGRENESSSTDSEARKLLHKLHELDQKSKKEIRKLEADESGNLLLDCNNPADVECYENDEEYNLILKDE